MQNINLIKTDIDQLNHIIKQDSTLLSLDQLDHYLLNMKSLSNTISSHVGLLVKEEEKIVKENEKALLERNQTNDKKKEKKKLEKNNKAQLESIQARHKDLEQQINNLRRSISSNKGRIDGIKEQMEAARKKINDIPLFGALFNLTGLTNLITDLAKDLSGVTALINQANDDIRYNRKLLQSSSNDLHQYEIKISEIQIEIGKLNVQINTLETKLFEYATKIKLLSEELVLTKTIIHGLKDAIIEIERAEGKTQKAKIFTKAFTRSRFKNVTIQNKAVKTLHEALDILNTIISQILELTSKQNKSRKRVANTAEPEVSLFLSTFNLAKNG